MARLLRSRTGPLYPFRGRITVTGAVEMGYFSNGTEGDVYQEAFCFRCVHWKDEGDGRGEGCPVWDAHLLFNYDESDNDESILNLLIPRDREGWNQQCAMFLEREGRVSS